MHFMLKQLVDKAITLLDGKFSFFNENVLGGVSDHN